MLMQQVEKHDGGYNEIIIDAKAWEASLPETIAAVFYPAFAHDDQKQHARDIHAAFLRRYRLTSDEVPLVEYNPRRIATRDVFRLVQ